MQRKLMQAQGEHANSMQQGPSRDWTQEPSCYEMRHPTTILYCTMHMKRVIQ